MRAVDERKNGRGLLAFLEAGREVEVCRRAAEGGQRLRLSRMKKGECALTGMRPELEGQVGAVDDEEDDSDAMGEAKDVGIGRREILGPEVGDERVVGDGDDAV